MGAKRRSHRPATTLEGRESQLVSLAFELAEQRMRQGTASAGEVVHFLKLGSTREQLEQSRLANENLLLSAKVDQLKSAKRQEELFEEAIKVMRVYTGQEEAPYDRY